MNYSELMEAIQDNLQNREDSFVARLDDFVRQAEQKIYRRANLPELRTMDTSTYSTTLDTESVTLNPDLLEIFSISLEDGSPLYRVDESYIREAYPDTSVTGTPYHYATVGRASLILGPVPDAAYQLIVHYSRFPESIVTAGQTWLGDHAEQALLYGAMVNGYRYLKGEPDMMQEYKLAFEEELALLMPGGSDTPQSAMEGTTP